MPSAETPTQAVSVYLLHAGVSWRATAKFLHAAVGLTPGDARGVARHTPSTIASLIDQDTSGRLISSLEKLGALAVARPLGESFPTHHTHIFIIKNAAPKIWLPVVLFDLVIFIAIGWATFKWDIFNPHTTITIPVGIIVGAFCGLLGAQPWTLSIELYARRTLLQAALQAWKMGEIANPQP